MEKIDIINQTIFTYDSEFKLLKTIELTGLEINPSYLDNCKLFTLNISNPIKRYIKFTELNGLDTQAEFQEFIYDEMTEQEKLDFDNLINQISNL